MLLLLVVVLVVPLPAGAQVLDLDERVLAERLLPPLLLLFVADWLLEQTERKLDEVLLFSIEQCCCELLLLLRGGGGC